MEPSPKRLGIVSRVRDDDRQQERRIVEFESFVREQGPALFRFAYLLCGEHASAEDIVQTALLKTFCNWEKVQRANRPESYVRRTVVNSYISSQRLLRSREKPVASSDLWITPPSRSDTEGIVESDISFWELVSGLSPRQRAIVVLRYYLDYTDKEIASLMGIRESTVRASNVRALNRVRTEISSRGRAEAAANNKGESNA